jgi:16S rRNA (uracil1498-N3)-methyltransferase
MARRVLHLDECKLMSHLPRFHCPTHLMTGDLLDLPAGPARHVQVRRMQPGDEITLFNGAGGECVAVITRMGRSDVGVRVVQKVDVERELALRIHVWAGITANERMDWLLEKATELGASNLLPITAERSVLKLKGERADKKLAHWQAIAVAASEQCGRNRVLQVASPLTLTQALKTLAASVSSTHCTRWILSLAEGTKSLQEAIKALPQRASDQTQEIILLSGPEGGLSTSEEAEALAAGFLPVSLGQRVLRAETAPIAVLSAVGLLF